MFPSRLTARRQDAVYGRFLKNISVYSVVRTRCRVMSHSSLIACCQEHSSVPIPQRPHCQGTAIPGSGAPQRISFTRVNDNSFPADLAFTGQCTDLVDKDSIVFAEQTQTINLRIEVFDLLLVQNLH